MALLNDMALFVEVVKARSFRRAADAIGMPNSTLSRRISALEKAIGLRLLHEQLGEMLAQPSGLLRVSLPVDFATIYLAPLIAEFAQRYPGISFEFDLTPRRVDMVAEPFDVAIRMGELADSQLIAR